MSRNLIRSNTAIFEALDRFCDMRGDPLKNAGKPRWIKSEKSDRRLMQHLTFKERNVFSSSKMLIEGELDTYFYVFTIGFDASSIPIDFQEIDVTAAHLTVLLSELLVRPKLTPLEIRNLVEVGDMDSLAGYVGHDAGTIRSIYPTIRVFSSKNPYVSPWKTFFKICVEESRYTHSWLSNGTIETLHVVCDLDPDLIPYKVLCRSIFDTDPGSLFLALYRTMERLYAYSSAKALSTRLGSSLPWDDVATALEDELSWWPREEGSLEKLLHFASVEDLKAALKAMQGQTDELKDVPRTAAKRIYKLRNALVHYRPSHTAGGFEAYDWNALCEAMAGIAMDIYDAIFTYRVQSQ